MRRKLTTDDIAPTALGGIVLLCGVGSMSMLERFSAAGAQSLAFGSLDYTTVDEYDDDDVLISVTGVGRVFDPSQRIEVQRDALEAARMVIEDSGRKPVGIFQGHAGAFLHWSMAAYLNLDIIDVAANTRAHPTIQIGAFGLAGDPNAQIIQAGYCSGRKDGGAPLSVRYRGNIANGEAIMRAAAKANGGALMAARGVYRIGFLKQYGAVGALKRQHDIGAALLATPEGPGWVDAAADVMNGRVAFVGRVTGNTVAPAAGGFSAGFVEARGEGHLLRLGVFNEILTVEIDGERVSTFPDVQAVFSPETGKPLAISELHDNVDIVLVVSDKGHFPTGAGVSDPEVYPDIESVLEQDISRYAIG